MKSFDATLKFVLSLILILIQPLAVVKASAASPFEACRTMTASDLRAPVAACALLDAPSVEPIQTLAAEIENRLKFQKRLESAVYSQIDSAIEKYDRMAKCERQCGPEVRDEARRLEKIRAEFRTELSLMQPDDPSPQASQGARGWYSAKPKHPFSKSPELAMLDPTETRAVKSEFLKRIAKFVPSVGARIDEISSGKDTIARNDSEFLEIQKASLKVRASARAKYLAYVGQDPLLIFLAETEIEITDQSIASASAKLRDEAKLEKTRLTGFTKQTDRAEALIQYEGIVETVLKSDPGSCVAAEKLAEQSDSARKSKSHALLAGQIGAGVLTAFLCGTGVACVAGAGILAATDFAIASEDAKDAFRSGVTNAVIETPSLAGKKETVMARADTAASLRGATLAMALPTFFSTGSAVVRASRSAFESTGTRTTLSTAKGQFINEVVGAPPISRLNSLSQIFYKDVLENHTGREREVIETLIERLRKQGIEPSKISTTIKERVRQCLR